MSDATKAKVKHCLQWIVEGAGFAHIENIRAVAQEALDEIKKDEDKGLVSEDQVRAMAFFATNAIRNHLNLIAAAAGWHPCQNHDPFYDKWSAKMDVLEELSRGKPMKTILEEKKAKMSPEELKDHEDRIAWMKDHKDVF